MFVSEFAETTGSPAGGVDRDLVPTAALVVDLALVEGQLRALWARRADSGPTPYGTALRDQLETHERDILQTLHRRHLAFRPLRRDTGLWGPAAAGPRW